MKTLSPLVRARVVLIVLALLSLVPAVVHYHFVDHRLGAARYPWGLLPVEFLTLRFLATASVWLSVGCLAAFLWSLGRPIVTGRLLLASTAATILFFVAYVCYALFIVAVLLASRNAQLG